MFTDMPPCPIGPVASDKICRRDLDAAGAVRASQKRALLRLGIRQCLGCKVDKPISEFYKSPTGLRGIGSRCKACTSEKFKDRYRNCPETKAYEKAKSIRRYENARGRATTIFHRVHKKFPDSTVTLDHIIKGIERGFCPVTGIKFDMLSGYQAKHDRARNPASPSIDRIDSRIGYTDANTRIVIWQYNAMKGELSDAEILEICKIFVAAATK